MFLKLNWNLNLFVKDKLYLRSSYEHNMFCFYLTNTLHMVVNRRSKKSRDEKKENKKPLLHEKGVGDNDNDNDNVEVLFKNYVFLIIFSWPQVF